MSQFFVHFVMSTLYKNHNVENTQQLMFFIILFQSAVPVRSNASINQNGENIYQYARPQDLKVFSSKRYSLN